LPSRKKEGSHSTHDETNNRASDASIFTTESASYFLIAAITIAPTSAIKAIAIMMGPISLIGGIVYNHMELNFRTFISEVASCDLVDSSTATASL
jgi:hypothetical protein